MTDYFVKINNDESVKAKIGSDRNRVLIDGKPEDLYIRKVNDSLYTVQKDSQNTDVIIAGRSNGNFILLIDGFYYFTTPKTKLEEMTELIMAESGKTSRKIEIKAPMPGLILDIAVTTGDAVQEGDHLLVLEAMKMENVIKSPFSGTVSLIKLKKHDSVEKGEILLVMERNSK